MGEVEDPDPLDGFDELTVIPLAVGKEKRLSGTGYRPMSVAFNEDETRAYVVTEQGISVIDLEAVEQDDTQAMVGRFDLTDDPVDDPATRDVTITPDGSLALVRVDGSADVGFVALDDGSRTTITLSGPVTDLDLNEAGTAAAAVFRNRSELVLLPVPETLTDSDAAIAYTILDHWFGSVSLAPDASTALLYTHQIEDHKDRLTIVQSPLIAADMSYNTVLVQTPIKAVHPAPDARHAIVFQEPAPGSSKAGAFSVVPTQAQIWPKLVGTEAPPESVAISPDGNNALVTVRNDAGSVYGVHWVQMPSLRVDEIRLASAPLATGIVPAAQKGYVAQLHPEGRLTLIDFSEPDGAPKTITGFELNAD